MEIDSSASPTDDSTMPGHKHGRSRKRQKSRPKSRSGNTPAAVAVPSELDQMWVVASEFDLGRAQTSLADLREMATRLPFEPAVLNVAALQARLVTHNSVLITKDEDLADQLVLGHPGPTVIWVRVGNRVVELSSTGSRPSLASCSR